MTLWLMTCTALAGPERLEPSVASFAAEDGAGALWVNPANLGYDPDLSTGIWYRQGLTEFDSAFAWSTSVAGLGYGLVLRTDAEGNPWWGLGSGLSIRLPEGLRIGTNVAWNLPSTSSNFVAWDLGIGWRPMPWLGLGAVARNVGEPSDLVQSTMGGGVVLRPLGERLELGFDYEQVQDSELDPVEAQVFRGSIVGRPTPGLELRVSGDSHLLFTGGFTVRFGTWGGGTYVEDNASAVTAYVGTEQGDERLLGLGKRVPIIRLDGSYPYQPTSTFFSAAGESYVHLLERLQSAATDKSAKAVVLKIERPGFSFAQIEELRAAIAEVQAADKTVIAYVNGDASNGSYLLASACDRVVLHPAGGLDTVGLSSEMLYFRGTLDLVGVEPQYARRSEYKSFAEQYTEHEPSDPAREQTDALLDDLFAAFVAGVARSRAMPEDDVLELIDGAPYSAQEALDLGLVDDLAYPEDLEELLAGDLPKGFTADDEYGMASEHTGWAPGRQLAIIYVTGAITGGESQTPGIFGGTATSGSKTVVRALRQAAEAEGVKAVVLRVDSGGGSAFASDEIWRAVEALKETDKPVVVSFGGVAASGGYYVAAGADHIFAEATTITGSIGVIGGTFSLGGLYDKLEIGTELHTRGRNAGMYASSRPMDPVEYAALDRLIGQTYELFKTRVSDGRGLTLEEVEEVARGRVWSGTRAEEVGLVDELGSFSDAIAKARALADIPERAEVDLVTFRGLETAWGDPVVERVQAAFRMDPVIELPRELQQLQARSALADERVLAITPWVIEVE